MNKLLKEKFICEDLDYELYCLLSASTIWAIFDKTNHGFEQVVAMDSVFVHSRCLFNFFTKSTSGSDISITEFGPNPYKSELYDTWKGPLNMHVLHINKGRANPTNVKGHDKLNEQVIPFANEILGLWDQFGADPKASGFSASILNVRQKAVSGAKLNTGSLISPLFT